MREITPEEKEAILALIEEVGVGAVLIAVAEAEEEASYRLEVEAAINYDSAKFAQAEACKAQAQRLRTCAAFFDGDAEIDLTEMVKVAHAG